MIDAHSETVPFYVIGPDGSDTFTVQVDQIPVAKYQAFADKETGALYGLTHYENGAPLTTIVNKQVWLQAKAQFGEIDREAETSHGIIMDLINGITRE